MSAEENKARYLDYLDALLHPDQLSAVLADGFVAHDLPQGMTLLEFRKLIMNVFPDQAFEAMHLIAEGDLVSCHLRAQGTHRGVFRGIPPTGNALTFDIFDLVRFGDDGKAAERWTLVDWIAFYRQMGVTQIPQG